MSQAPDPQEKEFWSTSKGRTVEILARDTIEIQDDYGFPDGTKADVIAYRFLGAQMIHLRTVQSLTGWARVGFE